MKPSFGPHPNAGWAAISGGTGIFAVWAIGAFTTIPLTSADGAVVATAAITARLLVGKHGLRGILRWCWQGDGP